MFSEKLERELAQHPQPWQAFPAIAGLVDANNVPIDENLVLYRLQTLEQLRSMQAEMVKEFQKRIDTLEKENAELTKLVEEAIALNESKQEPEYEVEVLFEIEESAFGRGVMFYSDGALQVCECMDHDYGDHSGDVAEVYLEKDEAAALGATMIKWAESKES
jgi:hypothetical protein